MCFIEPMVIAVAFLRKTADRVLKTGNGAERCHGHRQIDLEVWKAFGPIS